MFFSRSLKSPTLATYVHIGPMGNHDGIFHVDTYSLVKPRPPPPRGTVAEDERRTGFVCDTKKRKTYDLQTRCSMLFKTYVVQNTCCPKQMQMKT